MIPHELKTVLVSTPDTLSGAVRFVGTRVPVQALLDTLRSGATLDDFLDGYPGVTLDQARAVLDWEDMHARQVFGLEPQTS